MNKRWYVGYYNHIGGGPYLVGTATSRLVAELKYLLYTIIRHRRYRWTIDTE